MIDIVKSNKESLILRVTEDLIMENTREFYEEFNSATESSPRKILIDFSRIHFIDSTGIGVLLQCIDKLNLGTSGKTQSSADKSSAKEMTIAYICGLNKQITTVFKLAGLLNVFNVLNEREIEKVFPGYKLS